MAFLVETDSHHHWAVERFHELAAPFFCCEPVLTETSTWSAVCTTAPRRFFQLFDSDVLQIEFDLLAERAALRRLIFKYSDLPMSLADACLVRMTEQMNDAVIFTTDGGFRTYRKNGRQMIPLVIPG